MARRIEAFLQRHLPAWMLGALPVVGLVVLMSALSAIAPRAPQGRFAFSPESSAAPAAQLASPVPAVAAARATALPAPWGSGAAPEAGAIVFRSCCDKGLPSGVWRYDGTSGTVQPIASSGRPTVDGRGYLVRDDGRPFVLVDVESMRSDIIAPAEASDADAAPPDSAFVGAHVIGGAVWVSPRSGPAWRVGAELDALTVRISPDAKRLVVLAGVPHADPAVPDRIPTELWAIDLPHGMPRLLASLHPDATGPVLAPGSWSPDGSFFTYWEVAASATVGADGGPLRAVDARTGATHTLGVALPGTSRLSWKAPHTLAYVAGAGRGTWDGKTVRIWSPESGVQVVPTKGIALNPSWSADGTKLYLITADAHAYAALMFFEGRDSGDRRLSVYDLAGRTVTELTRISGFAYEGVRAAGDGVHLLVLWRTTYVARSVADLPPVEMTLGLYAPSTGRTRPLARIASDVGFGFYGSYEGPEGMGWSQGR